jgi:TonB-linked SusC/RagA family outer membrane protein
MKNKLLHLIVMITKFSLYGFFLQCLFLQLLMATDIIAQNNQSVREVKIEWEVKDAKIMDIFTMIEINSSFKFSYDKKDFDREKVINLTGRYQSIADVLLEISKQANVKFKQVNSTINVIKLPKNNTYDSKKAIEIFIQTRTVTGKVTSDDDREGLPGVNVIELGTGNGTVTDLGGNYSLNIAEGATLVFSSVGYTREEIVVGNRTVVNLVMMPDIRQLQELVVVGYGVQKKVNVTGAVSVVGGEELINRSVTGTVDALQGILPGVVVTRSTGSPGQENFEIQIRGLTSVNNNPVLVLIDGIEGNINNVRPEDVESISVLKDAASAAIYGAKAAGGVLLITTKKGKAGKISVEFNSYYSQSRIGRLQDRVSSYQGALMRNEADINTGGSATVNAAALAKLADPDILWEADPNNPNLYVFYGDYDYKKLVLHEYSPMISNTVAISGGTENTTFRLSGTYYENNGMIKIGPDSNTKYSGRLNLNTRMGKYFELSNNLSYSNNYIAKPYTNPNGTYGIFGYIFTYPGTTPLYDPNGHQVIGERIGNYDARIKFYDFSYDRGIREWNENNLRVNSTLTIKNLVKGLQFRIVGGLDANFDNEFNHEKRIQKYGIDGSVVGNITGATSVFRGQRNSNFKEFQFLTDYNLQISNHGFSLLGGYSYQDFRSLSFDGLGRNLINNNLADFNWSSTDNIVLNDRIATNRFQSLFGRLTYNFKDRYLFETNVRYDGSSKLSPHDQYRLFPSASVAWRVNEENWFNVGVITELKIRSSFGQLGNAGVLGNYDYIPLLNIGNDILLGRSGNTELQQQYVTQNTLASKNITWETVESSNLGIDLGLFENKLTVTGDYFIKKNKNMLARVAYPSVIGIGLGNMNVGELKTWGWEASVGWRERKGPLNYWFSAHVGDAENELVEYLGADIIGAGTIRLLQGRPINSIFGYKTDGLFQTQEEVDQHAFQSNLTRPGDVKYIDINGDGRITSGTQTEEDHGDLEYLGNTNPRYSFGFQSGFNWKGLDFSVFFQGVGKRVFLLSEELIQPYWRAWIGPAKHNLDYWTPENTDAFWPRLYIRGDHNFLPSDKWLQNAAYIRLKDIQIGYTLPVNLISKVGIEKLRFYIAGHDIWEATNVLSVIDPETPNRSTYQYPFRRTYTVGINLTF